MQSQFREFYIPLKNEDLEDYEKTGPGRYVIDEVHDVGHISQDDQLAMLRAVFVELGRSAVTHVHEGEMVGHLYSFVKALPLPGVVSKEVRALLAHECAEKLTRLLTSVASHIRRENAAKQATGGVDRESLALPRSCAKVYTFVLCNVLLSTVSEDVSTTAGGEVVAVSQPIRRGRGGGGRGAAGRGRGGASQLAIDEDWSGVDISGREQVVLALSRLFDDALQPMWREGGQVEDPVVTLVLRVALHLMSQKRNVDGDHNAVCGSLQALLSAAAHCICAQYQRAEAARVADGASNNAPNPVDILISPLIELLLKYPFTAKFLARWMADVDSAGALHEEWTGPLLQHLYEGITSAACDNVTGDTQAAKNITTFMEELSRHRITLICRFPECTVTMLQAESYEVRKAGITVSAEMLVQKFSGQLQNPADEKRRDDILRELLSHMLDLNPFTRTHCLHQLGDLVKKKAVPRSFFLTLCEAAVGRLEDKSYLVRNAAFQLVGDIVKRNWFGTVLARDSNLEKFVAHSNEAKKRFVDTGRGEEAFVDAWNAARAATRPLSSTRRSLRLDDPSGVGDVEPDVLEAALNGSSDDDDDKGADNGAAKQRPSTVAASSAGDARAAASATTAGGNASTNTASAPPNDPDIVRLVYYENALVFIGLVEKALAHAVELLDSRNERNVIEAIRFIVICSEYRLEGSIAAALRFIVMVFEGEVNIQQAVRDGFYAVFFQCFMTSMAGQSAMRKCLASVLKIVSVLRIAGEGEVNAIDRLFRLLKAENSRVLSDLFYDAVWSVVDGSVDRNHSASSASASGAVTVDATERRVAMRLYAMLAAVHPRDVALRRQVLVDLLAQHGTDNLLLAYGFQALQHEALNRGYVFIEDNVDPNLHPVLRLLVRHVCRPTSKLGSWMPMADAAINAIHALVKTPIIVYTSMVQYIYQSLQVTSVESVAGLADGSDEAAVRVAQLLHVLGHTALKHLVSIDTWERAQLKQMEEAERAAAAAAAATQQQPKSARSSGVLGHGQEAHLDVMHKELGMGSTAARRHEIEDAAVRKKIAMFRDKKSIWALYSPIAVRACKQVPKNQHPQLRVAAVLCLSKLMIASEDFCAKHLPLLFTIASLPEESWIVKTNVLLAIGDLTCVHCNLVDPYNKMADRGLFALLHDEDVRVRAVTIQICSHLVLSEMLRVGDRLHALVALVADEDATIRANAITFVRNFALKHRKTIGNMIPPLVPILSESMPADAFQESLKTLLDKVEKDKPTESLIEKLCERFGPYTETSRKKRVIAQNLAFCLSELDYTAERAMKKLMSEHCYQMYRQWLRDEIVLGFFQSVASKSRKHAPGRPAASTAAADGGAPERRDRAAIDEWELRLLSDASVVVVPQSAARGDAAHATSTEDGSAGAAGSPRSGAGRDAVDDDGLPRGSGGSARQTTTVGGGSARALSAVEADPKPRHGVKGEASSSDEGTPAPSKVDKSKAKRVGKSGGAAAPRQSKKRARKVKREDSDDDDSSSSSDSSSSESDEDEEEGEVPARRGGPAKKQGKPPRKGTRTR